MKIQKLLVTVLTVSLVTVSYANAGVPAHSQGAVTVTAASAPANQGQLKIYNGDRDITDNPEINFKNKKDQNVILTIKSSRAWTYYNDSPVWLKVSKDSSSSTLTLLVPDRNKEHVRSAIITIKDGKASINIKVSQDGDLFKTVFKK